MANPIIKILRGATPPSATLQAGQLAMDQVAKNLYLGVEVGGVVTNEIVAGSGTFATKSYVDTATGSLGTMSTQDADSVAITGGTIDGTTIGATTPSTGNFTTLEALSLYCAGTMQMDGSGDLKNVFRIGMNGNIVFNDDGGGEGRIINLSDPVDAQDAATKNYVDTAVSDLGSVFHYAGNVSEATTPFDLSTLGNQMEGAYYRVDVAGAYTHGSTTFNAKVGDAFVKTGSGFQKIDNVDVEVLGTANEISVTGDENAGYTVALDSAFKTRVSTAETDITDLETKTQNIDNGTTAGLTSFTGEIYATGGLGCDGSLNSLGDGNFNGTVTATAVDISGNATFNGNIVGDGSTEIQNCIIDGGVY